METLTGVMNDALDAMRAEAEEAAKETTKEIGVAQDAAVATAADGLAKGACFIVHLRTAIMRAQRMQFLCTTV